MNIYVAHSSSRAGCGRVLPVGQSPSLNDGGSTNTIRCRALFYSFGCFVWNFSIDHLDILELSCLILGVIVVIADIVMSITVTMIVKARLSPQCCHRHPAPRLTVLIEIGVGIVIR